jgi:hypothetical protein
MADSTTNVDNISSSQAQKEVTANAFFDAVSPASAFARRASTVNALTWGFYGISRWHVNNTATPKSNGTVTLTGSAIRYVVTDRALAVTEVSSGFPTDKLALYKCTNFVSTVASYEDYRDPHHFHRFLYGRFTLAMADANKTLTYEQAMCESMELTGALGALRDVIVPLVPRAWTVFANTTGGFGVRVIGVSGTGITVADSKRAIVECDGTNVVRVTADA